MCVFDTFAASGPGRLLHVDGENSSIDRVARTICEFQPVWHGSGQFNARNGAGYDPLASAAEGRSEGAGERQFVTVHIFGEAGD